MPWHCRVDLLHQAADLGSPRSASLASRAAHSSSLYVPDTTATRHAVDVALGEPRLKVAELARGLGVHRSTVYRHRARQRGD